MCTVAGLMIAPKMKLEKKKRSKKITNKVLDMEENKGEQRYFLGKGWSR